MRKLLNWLDRHILKIGVGFLLFFIPLWPKFPLISIPHTWVYIRLEDIFLSIVVLIWFIQILRRKVTLVTPLTLPIFVYWLVGGISLAFSLIFLARSIPNFFPHVAFLHWLRRIEYMIVFFVALSTVKSIKDVYHYLIILAITILGVIFYGFGQKFLGFPAFLTMNEEFAKGIPLYLPAGARITSTFAGHYDLAAYLVFVIAILGSLIFGVRNFLAKIVLFILSLLSFVLLLLTASRVSFVVYLITVSTMLWWQKKKVLIIPVIILSMVFLNFVSGAGERFAKTFRVSQVVYDIETGRPIAMVERIEEGKVITKKEKSPAEESLPTGSGYIGLPVAPTTMTVSMIKKQGLATTSGEVATISGRFLIQKALIYDISFTTRFQGEWPRALAAFNRNPLLGSGYSSISLATDNDYLRILGETGLAGLFSFIFLFTTLAIFIKLSLAKINQPFLRGLTIGVAAGLTGLFLNAILIDVFEASKVALTLWLILGITLGGLRIFYKPHPPAGEPGLKRGLLAWLSAAFRESVPPLSEIKKIIFHPAFPIIILFIANFVLLGKSLANYFVGDDFIWLRWAAEGTFSQVPSYFTSAAGFFYRPIQKTIYLALFNIFWLMPGGYRLLSLLVHFGVATGIYLLASKITKKRFLPTLTSFIFLVMSVHGESVFWISTIGHTLSSLFIIWGLLFYALFRLDGKKLFYPLSFISLALACLSYDGAVVGPLLVLWFEFTLGKKKLLTQLPLLVLIPAYIVLRNWAGAHGLSGDYNYNLRLLPVNFLGNLLGYLGLIFVGPNFISLYDVLRTSARSAKEVLVSVSSGVFLLSIILFAMLRKKIKISSFTVFSLGFIPVALLPFLGLGNITERYAYLASAGGAWVLGIIITKTYEKLKEKSFYVGIITVTILSIGLFIYYLNDLNRSQSDWQKAGEITYNALLGLRKNYLQQTQGKTFYFVDVPIRNGRAWVFPVGLPDALWHTFRDESLKVSNVKTLDEALDLKDKTPSSHVFVLEEGEIREVFRETKQVPIKDAIKSP